MLTAVGLPIRERPLGRSRRRWENRTRIRMDPKEIDINTRNWVIRLKIGIIGELNVELNLRVSWAMELFS